MTVAASQGYFGQESTVALLGFCLIALGEGILMLKAFPRIQEDGPKSS